MSFTGEFDTAIDNSGRGNVFRKITRDGDELKPSKTTIQHNLSRCQYSFRPRQRALNSLHHIGQNLPLQDNEPHQRGGSGSTPSQYTGRSRVLIKKMK